MGIRSVKKQIAKARMAAGGVGNINSKMSMKYSRGVPGWRRATEGNTGEEARRVQMNLGRLIKAKDEAKKTIAKRKIRKVEA